MQLNTYLSGCIEEETPNNLQGISAEELFQHPSKYAGKDITVHGEIEKICIANYANDTSIHLKTSGLSIDCDFDHKDYSYLNSVKS